MHRYWTLRNCASSEGLGLALHNSISFASTFKIFGSDGWEIVWPGSRTQHISACCDVLRPWRLSAPRSMSQRLTTSRRPRKKENKCAWVTQQYAQTAVPVLAQTPVLQGLWIQTVSLWCYEATQPLAPTGQGAGDIFSREDESPNYKGTTRLQGARRVKASCAMRCLVRLGYASLTFFCVHLLPVYWEALNSDQSAAWLCSECEEPNNASCIVRSMNLQIYKKIATNTQNGFNRHPICGRTAATTKAGSRPGGKDKGHWKTLKPFSIFFYILVNATLLHSTASTLCYTTLPYYLILHYVALRCTMLWVALTC